MHDLSIIKPTYMEHWPEEIRPYSLPYQLLPIAPEVSDALMAEAGYGEYPDPTSMDALLSVLESAIESTAIALLGKERYEFEGFFAKMSSRSPKDAWPTGRPFRSGREVIMAFVESDRVTDDLARHRANRLTSYLAVRPFVDIHPEHEFRCFIQNREVRGISQYNYRSHYPWIERHASDIVQKVVQTTSFIIPKMNISDMVMDVVVTDDSCTMIEINPYFQLTDPCLFDWKQEPMFAAGGIDFRWNVESSSDTKYVSA